MELANQPWRRANGQTGKIRRLEAILEQLIEQGPGDLAGVFRARAFELAMQIERERFLGAGHYERTPETPGLCQWHQAKAHRHAPRAP